MSKKLRNGWTQVARDQWEAGYRGISLCVQKRDNGYTAIADLYDFVYARSRGIGRLYLAQEWAESMVDAHWAYCARMRYQRKPKK
jgi:hypothetical protein